MREAVPEPAKIQDHSIAAVVLVSSQHGGLGVIRSLGRAGVDVYGVHQHRWEPSAHSRYLRGVYRWDFESASDQESLKFLLQLASELGGDLPVLIPTSDTTAAFVAQNADALAKGYRFSVAPAEVVGDFVSKGRTADVCRRLGVPIPATLLPVCESDVLEFADRVRCPVIVKGDYGSFRVKGQRRARVLVVHGERELLDIYRLNASDGQPTLVLQEFVPGADDNVWMFNGYFNRRSECLFGATGRKIHQFPIHRGATCLGMCESNEAVFQPSLSLMEALGYCGPVDIDYRFDDRDGQYKLLDVNPRLGATFRLFTATNELDVARALYLDATGQGVPPADVSEGRKWIVETNDLVSGVAYLLERQLTVGQWLSAVRGVQEGVWLSLDDPAPSLALPMMFFQKHHTLPATPMKCRQPEMQKS